MDWILIATVWAILYVLWRVLDGIYTLIERAHASTRYGAELRKGKVLSGMPSLDSSWQQQDS
jgi:hypothetical protein